jgi:sec-independent protein translocase protein TatA
MGLDNPLHIAFLVVLLLLVFGAKRLPEIGRSLGSGMREFKQSVTGESHSQHPALPAGQQPQQVQQEPAPVAQPAPAQAPVATPAQAPVAAQAQAPVAASAQAPVAGPTHAPVAEPAPSQAGAGEGEQRD